MAARKESSGTEKKEAIDGHFDLLGGLEKNDASVAAAVDLGSKAIERVWEVWQVDTEWSVKEGRGFTWWAKDYRQRVWYEPYTDKTGSPVCKLCAATDSITGLKANDETYLNILSLSRFSSLMAAPVFDDGDGTVRLWTTMYLDEGNAVWAPIVFSGFAIAQPIAAQFLGNIGSSRLKGKPDISHHPRSGVRAEGDDMLNVINRVFAPLGKKTSPWSGSGEMERVCDFLKGTGVFSTAGPDVLTAEFPFGVQDEGAAATAASGSMNTSMVIANAMESHPVLGSGVMVRLHIRHYPEMGNFVENAVKLNFLEAETFKHGFDLVGSWYTHQMNGDVLAFVSFIPSAFVAPGRLQYTVLGMGNRSRWAESVLLG
jgi:hypothetical protein